jgi:hypothetical protein
LYTKNIAHKFKLFNFLKKVIKAWQLTEFLVPYHGSAPKNVAPYTLALDLHRIMMINHMVNSLICIYLLLPIWARHVDVYLLFTNRREMHNY